MQVLNPIKNPIKKSSLNGMLNLTHIFTTINTKQIKTN